MRLVFYRIAASALTLALLASHAARADQCTSIRTNIVTGYALGADCTSVVVRKPAPIQTIIADSIPFFARHLASLAADAKSRIR